MFSHIVIAWDGSEHARRAFDYAIAIAERFGARVEVVSVARAPDHAETSQERASSIADARAFYERRALPLIEHARERGVEARLVVVEGDHPADDVITAAHQLGADLIVVGRRGLSPVERFLSGSVSDRISRYAPCAVLVVGSEPA
ncbi:MAG TPA: universal stress protein [Candidatus Dormibacteraeota bacterium]|nr:universal stress protein [Candidatus Dormibacteraeota bacterium]